MAVRHASHYSPGVAGIRASLRSWAWVVLTVGLAFALAAVTDPDAAQADCTPLPPLITCPASPITALTAPVVTVAAPTMVTTQTATLNGTIDPEGATTTYHWVYADASGNYLGEATPVATLSSGSSPQPVSTSITGLRPGVSYTITLYASNSQGDRSAALPAAFTTVAHPVLSVTVSATSIDIAQAFQVFVRRTGSYDPYGPVYVYIAKSPFHHWVNVGEATAFSHGRLAVYPCPAGYQYDGGCPWLDRNFEVRAQMGASSSPSRLVYVYPSFFYQAEREDYNSSPYLDLTYTANVHRADGYPDPLVYFYDGPARNGPFTRVATRRFRHRRDYGGEQLIASARISNPGAGYSFACIKRQLFRDMGRSFSDPKCGLPRIA
jgi:hypothetical protein